MALLCTSSEADEVKNTTPLITLLLPTVIVPVAAVVGVKASPSSLSVGGLVVAAL